MPTQMKSWKQIDLDLHNAPSNANVRGKIRDWQVSQDETAPKHETATGDKPNVKIVTAEPTKKQEKDKDKDTPAIVTRKRSTPAITKKNGTPVIVAARPSPAKLNHEVKAATTPKKRVVSDEHWRKSRTPAASPQSAPVTAQKVIPDGATHGFYKTAGSPKYDAWVRKRKKSPPRPAKELQEDVVQESDDPLDLLYWMTGKPKVPLGVRTTSSKEQVPEPKSREELPQMYLNTERRPERDSPPAEKATRKTPSSTPKHNLRVSREASPISGRTSLDERRPSNPRIQSWLGRTPNRYDAHSASDEDDYDDYSSISGYPSLQKLSRETKSPKHRSSGRHDHDRHRQSDDDDYFSTRREPGRRERHDNDDDTYSEVTTPTSPGSPLRRRGAKRMSGSPRKSHAFPASTMSYADTDLSGSLVSDMPGPTVYSTIENERHGPIRYIRRSTPVLVDISSRRTSSKTASPPPHDASPPRMKDPENAKESAPPVERPAARRKITTDDDLMSVLSLAEPRKTGIPRPRTIVDSVDITEILHDLRADEEQYLGELKTLVDDVVPVLLSSVLSKADQKDMAEAFRPSSNTSDTTTAIVNIGVALERLKTCHQRMPTQTPMGLILWAETAYKVYEDYLKAWRLGFQNVTVDVRSKAGTTASSVFAATAENTSAKVNVSYLLRRPLIRVKYLARSIKALSDVEGSSTSAGCALRYQDLVLLVKRRQDEERARLEDEAAASIDSSKAREPHTLAPTVGVKIDTARCVRARDFFTLQLQHSTGQLIDCSVELILRDNKIHAGGDILICEVDIASKWLLFPPVQTSKMSARLGTDLHELIVMIRGMTSNGAEWREVFTLRSPEEHTIRDWHRMLGSSPMPPAIAQLAAHISAEAPTTLLDRLSLGDVDVPLGEPSMVGFSPPNTRSRTSSNTRSAIWDQPVTPRRPVSVEGLRTPATQAQQRPPMARKMSAVPSEATPNIRRSRPASVISGAEYGSSPVHSASPPTMKRKPVSTTSSVVSTSAAGSPQKVTAASPQNHRKQAAPAVSFAPNSPSTPQKGPRRSSSPLKHEYRPEVSSATASDFDDDYSEDDRSFTSESSIDDYPLSPLDHWKPLHSQLTQSMYSESLSGSLAPSDSASQAAYAQTQVNEHQVEKTFASIFYWSSRGSWECVHDDDCLIFVSPGLIEAFDVASTRNWINPAESPSKSGIRPIVALELTPLVPLRRGTALDISVRSPPTANSRFQGGSNIMFRSRNGQECATLYGLMNQARINNPTYIAMQNARGPVGGGAWSAYMDRRPGGSRNISSWWRFGSKKSSYRKTNTERTPSVGQTEGSSAAVSNAMSALKRLGTGQVFGLSRSSPTTHQGASRSASSGETTSDGVASPMFSSEPAEGGQTGISNKRIRLYFRESATKWRDMGSARLTILHPNQPAIIAPSGHLIQEKRIVITGKVKRQMLLDVTLGESSFERVARTGIAVSVVEDLVDRDGRAVDVGSTGGVGGNKVKVYMLQMKSEAEAAYMFSLVGKLRY